MAVVAPQTVLHDALSHQRDRSSLSKREVAKHELRSSSLLASSVPSIQKQHSSSRRCLRCAAVTGGSKRDVEKIVAKTQNRRPRHVKGMTPSKPELMEELEEEEAAEEDISKEVSELLDQDSTPGLSENFAESSSNGSSQVEGKLKGDSQVEDGLQARDTEDSEDSSESNVAFGTTEDVKGLLPTPEDSSINQTIDEQSSSSSSESEDELSDEIGDSARAVADVTSDTASEVGTRINETGQQVQQDVAEVASEVGDTVSSQTKNTFDTFNEQAGEVQDSAKAVADVAMDTTSYVNKKVGETGEKLGQDLSEVASTGRTVVQSSSDAMGEQAKEFTSRAEKVLKEEGDLLEQGSARFQREANQSLGRIQDSVQKAIRESSRAARDVGVEAFGLGEVLLDTAKETIQGTSAIVQNRGLRSSGKRGEKENGSLRDDSNPQTSQQDENETSDFTDFKVLVAGASGQTGRLVVGSIASKGASVRALVRDVYKARSISQLKDCECVEADLYKYETVRNALGDCNVVICAIGARALPFDPLNTFQVEYEGVVNLISAAKNQGKVKKFILISTIGVTYLQLVPLIFWKKQAELYLQRSGLDYTIVRPGGLRNANGPEDVVMQGADSQLFGGISRKKVAEVCLAALVSPDASHKIVEVVSMPGTQKRSIADLFKQV